jgi:hypothetical protein
VDRRSCEPAGLVAPASANGSDEGKDVGGPPSHHLRLIAARRRARPYGCLGATGLRFGLGLAFALAFLRLALGIRASPSLIASRIRG